MPMCKTVLYGETLQMQFETTADQDVLLSFCAEEDGITQLELSSRCSSDRREWQVFLTDARQARHAHLRQNSGEIRDVLNGVLEPEELTIIQKTLDRIADAFTR